MLKKAHVAGVKGKALLLIFLIAAVGLAVFIAAFDIDRYRPMITARIEEAVGNPVQIEKISLGWRGGIAVQGKGLSVLTRGTPQAEPALRVESVDGVLRLAPLLRRKVELASIVVVKPQIHLIRSADGMVRVDGISPPEAKGKAASAGQPVSPSGVLKEEKSAEIPFDVDRVVVSGGSVRFTDLSMQPPFNVRVEGMEAEVTVRGHSFTLKRFSARVAEGTVKLSGSGEEVASQNPRFSFRGEAENLRLEELIRPRSSKEEPYVRGKLSLAFQGAAQGTGPALIGSLSGDGSLRLRDGALANVNVLREVFGRISIIPGLAETLAGRLPASYQEKFEARDTILEPVDLKCVVRGGIVVCDDLRLAADAFALAGRGSLSPDMSARADLRLEIDTALSEAIVRSVEELRALTDERGRMAFPIRVQGPISRPEIVPDLEYIGSRVVVGAAENLIGGLLEKILEKNLKE